MLILGQLPGVSCERTTHLDQLDPTHDNPIDSLSFQEQPALSRSIMGGRVRFDPTKPIDDPTVWYPHPDLWVKFKSNSKGRSGDGDDDDPDHHAFALDSTDFAQLNRYVWTAKLLPTTRNEYMSYNSIPSNNELPEEIWNAADGVIATYTDVSDGNLVHTHFVRSVH